MTDKRKQCEGCRSRRFCAYLPFIRGSKPRVICPCSLCVVKVMCNGICEEFQDYKNEYGEGYAEWRTLPDEGLNG